jgi:hypothetical protein
MVEFLQKDADDLARVKDVMPAKALEGDAHAASAFATILSWGQEFLQQIP